MRGSWFKAVLILLAMVVFVWRPLSAKAAGLDPSYTYDLNGNRSNMTDPTGTTTYEYDALNRLTKITNPSGQVITYTYDAIGRRTKMTLPNGIVTSYNYDAASRLTSLVHELKGAAIAGLTYTYAQVGS